MVTSLGVGLAADGDLGDTRRAHEVGVGRMPARRSDSRHSIFIAAVPAPANGPQGASHLVLLEDQSGSWVIANSKFCPYGQATRTIPSKLGTVCGVQ